MVSAPMVAVVVMVEPAKKVSSDVYNPCSHGGWYHRPVTKETVVPA